MFYIRELSGLISPYVPGTGFNRPTVRSVDAVSPAMGANPSYIDSHQSVGPLREENTPGSYNRPALAAYERVAHPDTPRQRVIYAAELMTKELLTIEDNASLGEGYRLFTEHRFRHLPVVNSENALVGILSDRDLLQHAANLAGSTSRLDGWAEERVHRVMSNPVLVATSDTEVREVARVMCEEHIGCMPIVDDKSTLAGIVTRTDILKTLLMQAPLELWR